MSEKVIIAPAWGGHIDFIKHYIQLPGSLTNVHPSAAWENVIMQESQWFSVDYGQASEAMKFALDKKNAKATALLAKRQAAVIKKQYMLEHMQTQLQQYLDKYVPEMPTQVQLKLPQLKKIELPKLKKI